MNPFKKFPWLPVALLIFVSALTYLPNIQHFTYYRDDWYYMLDGTLGGAKIFHEMFRIDRPARGYVFEWLFTLFGTNPLPYHLTAYLWRAMSGLAAYWLFKLVWPGKSLPAFWGALLFTLFPGYLWWVAGIEYQPIILSVFLQVVSIALTLQAIQAQTRETRILMTLGALLTGWLYIALVDYAIGMEIFRLLCVYIVINRYSENLTWIKKGWQTIRAWAIHALIPIGFMIWRLFIFQNTRKETEIGRQLGELLISPVLTGTWWLIRLFQSAINVAFLAWGTPFYTFFFDQRLRDILNALILLLVAITILILTERLYLRQEKYQDTENTLPPSSNWQKQAIWIGLIGTVMGVLPVIFANRLVVFNAYSHYALPASLAGVTLLIGLIYALPSPRSRFAILLILTSIGFLTHRANAMNALHEEEIVAKFWWQVAWRIPQLDAGTTLVVNYPGFNYGEDVDIIWGPANFIYGLDTEKKTALFYNLSALPLTSKDALDILIGKENWSETYRSHTLRYRYDRVLVLSQPWTGACVHILDNRRPVYSSQENSSIILASPKSETENILDDFELATPPEYLFGPEPSRTWCYYYEKAELAVQKNEWESIISLGREALEAGLKPNDPIEWIPFIQAYSILGDEANLEMIASRLGESYFYRDQVCLTLETMLDQGFEWKPEIQEKNQTLFCR